MRRFRIGLKRTGALILWFLGVTAFRSAVVGGDPDISPGAYAVMGIALVGIGVLAWLSASDDRAALLGRDAPEQDEDADESDHDLGPG